MLLLVWGSLEHGMIQTASTAAGRPVDRPPTVGFSFFGLCKLPNGTDVNAWLVRQGWALATGFVKIYQSEQDEPEAKRGTPWKWQREHPR
jgi:hypothetical protein